LRELSLEWSGITDDGLKAIGPLPALETLSLIGCTEITDQSLEYCKAFPKLREVSVNATNITEAAVRAFKKAKPAVEIRHGAL
jgi:hypothetical protein